MQHEPVGVLRDPDGIPESLRCVVLYYAVMDPTAAVELGIDGILEQFQANHDATEAVAASKESLPRFVVARAGQDYASINRSLDRFVTAALDANSSLDLMNHPSGEHAFDVVNDDERSRKILRHSLNIVRSVLSAGHP